MSSPSQSSESAASDGAKTDTNTVVDLKANPPATEQGPQSANSQELNQRLENLEQTLSKLREGLDSTSKSFEQAQALNNSSSEQLGIELQGAREQLKSLEGAYETLGAQSNELSSQQVVITEALESRSQELAERVDHLQFELAAQIVKMSDESVKQFDLLTTEQAQLERRSKELAEQSAELKLAIEQGITSTQAAITALELKLIDQLQQLESDSIERDQSNTDATKTVSSTLLSTTKRLDKADNDQQAAFTELDQRITKRSDELQQSLDSANETLADHSYEITDLHVADVVLASQIETLEETTAKQQSAHLMLVGRVRTGFRWQIAGLALVALALVGYVVLQQQSWDAAESRELALVDSVSDTNARQTALHSAVSEAINDIDAQQTATQELSDKHKVLAQDVELKTAKLTAQIALLNEKLQTLNDQSQSLNGRLNASSPFQQFADDNIIHGPEWLAKQDSSAFMVKLITVEDKQELYNTADFYSHFLKQKLAFYAVTVADQQRYVLLAGVYTSREKAQQLIEGMPAPSFDEKPSVEVLGTIQTAIKAQGDEAKQAAL